MPPSESHISDAEVLDAFQGFFEKRSAAAVIFAEAVTNVTLNHGVGRTTFDSVAAGATSESLESVSPFSNLAHFAAGAISSNDALGNRVRPAVESMEAVRADATPLVTCSHAEILAINNPQP